MSAGYTNLDAACNNGILASGGMQTGDIPPCPTLHRDRVHDVRPGHTRPPACASRTNLPDSTPCTDSDGNACTTAGCEMGQCVQTHMTTTCQPDSNECTNDLACDPATGLCPHPPKPDSTPCTDSDGNACTAAGCEAGQCVQTHMTTTCQPDSNECTNDLACDPSTGLCPHPPKPDSTPCTDSDGNACTAAGCEAGQCVQTHVTTTCQPDTNECTNDLACDPATGACNHPPKPDSTPCGDTDHNACTTPGCEAGQCVQTHVTTTCQPDSNECTPGSAV